MKLWQKNYDINKIIEDFTVGKDRELDLHLARFDVIGSVAHIKMLHEIGLLKNGEYGQLYDGLIDILNGIDQKGFVIESDVEDVHSQVEIILTGKLGDAGKKIHSGRSRNDQVLLDLKLYMRHSIRDIVELANSLFARLINLSETYAHVLLPGYTHFQVAMPSSFGLWFGAYAESLTDDLLQFKSAFEIVNQNPLGSAAGYGTSFPINRSLTTKLLGFDDLNYNVVYAQMGRGKAEKVMASAIALMADTLGKLASDVCLYVGQDFGFISFPDEFMTGSSIMPHKKNPDVFELIRGRCNHLKALPNEISLITTNLPSGYHRDLQLLKEGLIEAVKSLKDCLYLMEFMLAQVRVKDNIVEDKKYSYLFTVEKVNELVLDGMAFRDAYRKVSEMIENGSYEPVRVIKHTHEGSIGNLCNDKISDKMQLLNTYFASKFRKIDEAFEQLALK